MACRSHGFALVVLAPQPPLFPPVGHGGDLSNVVLQDRLLAALNPWQEEELLLDVGSQVQQAHDLRHAGPRDMAEGLRKSIVSRDSTNNVRHREGVEMTRFKDHC